MEATELKKESPRFQECGKLVKLWRYRHYIPIPFQWIWAMYIRSIFITDDTTLEREKLRGTMLWSILKGSAQIKMRWYYTMEEMEEHISELKKGK